MALIFNTLFSFGQNETNAPLENKIDHQIGLRHDNDLFLLTDRYYSAGLFLTYRRRLQKGVFRSGNEQLVFSLGEEIITPTDLKSKDIADLDRPYAGFLGFTGGWSHAGKSSLVEGNLLFGVAGSASGAGTLQQWFHKAIVSSDAPTWVGELENSIHTNLYVAYTYEWQLAPNPFSVHVAAHPQIAFGTRDVYFHPELTAHFGRRNTLSSSMAYTRIGSTDRETFFVLRAGYRFVGRNGLLEGNALGDDSVFLVSSNTTVFYGGFDFQVRRGKNEFWYGYRINSAESGHTEAHQYMLLSYARNF